MALSGQERQRALAPYERIYANELFKVLDYAGRVLASRAERGETLAQLQASITDLVARPVLEVYEKMFYHVELDFGRLALQDVLGKSAGMPDVFKAGEWELWDPYKSPEMQNWNSVRTATNIAAITDSTRRRIRSIVEQALADGSDNAQIAKLLRQMYGFSRDRATRIAQTEINSAQNAASHYSLQQFADPKSLIKSWLATNDKRTRDTHEQAHSSQRDIPFIRPFIVGGSELQFPGDSSLGAAAKEIIRCRCTATYVRDPNYRGPIPQVPSPSAIPSSQPAVKPPPKVPKKPKKPVFKLPVATGTRAGRIDPKLLARLAEMLANAPDDLIRVLNKTGKLRNLYHSEGSAIETAYYIEGRTIILRTDLVQGTVKSWADFGGTLVHELGHHLDYTILPSVSNSQVDQALFAATREMHGLGTAIKEVRAMIARLPGKQFAELKSALRSYYVSAMVSPGLEGFANVAVTDIFGAISRGAIGAGHTIAYYQLESAPSEVIAGLTYLYSNPVRWASQIAFLDKWAPSLMQDFKAFLAYAGG